MPTITATLVGVADPQFVQITVTDLPTVPTGSVYVVRGVWSGGMWDVRGGTGVVSSSQVVLADAATPVNVPISYSLLVGGIEVATSGTLVVDYGDDFVLQSLDGHSSARFNWQDNGLPLEQRLRAAVFTIPGRSTPVVMYDMAAGESGELEVLTEGVHTGALLSLIRRGGPLLLRTNGDVRDIGAVQYVQITGAASRLTGVGIQTTNQRRWSLPYLVIADPEPGTLIASSTWEHFDEAHTGLTWADFDAQWTGATWADFDRYDWASQ